MQKAEKFAPVEGSQVQIPAEQLLSVNVGLPREIEWKGRTVRRCGSSRQYGWLLQKSQHYGRLLVAIHYRCGKIFDRWIVQYRRAITCVLVGRRCKVMSRKVGSTYGWVFAFHHKANGSKCDT